MKRRKHGLIKAMRSISFRILENYTSASGQTTSVEELLDSYRKATPDKENCLAHFEICRLVKKLFPKIKESKIRSPEGRKRVYFNLAPATSATSDVLAWHTLQNYSPKFDFIGV